MDREKFFIEHCNELFQRIEVDGKDLSDTLDLDVDVDNLVFRGKEELKTFIEQKIKVDYLFTEEAKDMLPVLQSVNEGLILLGLIQMLEIDDL